MGTNYYFDLKNSKELSESISKQIEVLDADEVRARLFDRIHICKLSAGWKPLFQITEYYGSLDELKEFYEQNKGKYAVINEYHEPVEFYELIEECAQRNNDDAMRTHLSVSSTYYYRTCASGYEWSEGEFS
jgi:hypothetical protein